MKGVPKTAKFLGINGLAKPYPGHRLHIQEGLLRKLGLKKDILYQDGSIVSLLIGSNSSSLFPTVLYQQDNVIIAQSKFTGKYLIQGATKFLDSPNRHLAVQTLQLNTLQFDDLPPRSNPNAKAPKDPSGNSSEDPEIYEPLGTPNLVHHLPTYNRTQVAPDLEAPPSTVSKDTKDLHGADRQAHQVPLSLDVRLPEAPSPSIETGIAQTGSPQGISFGRLASVAIPVDFTRPPHA